MSTLWSGSKPDRQIQAAADIEDVIGARPEVRVIVAVISEGAETHVRVEPILYGITELEAGSLRVEIEFIVGGVSRQLVAQVHGRSELVEQLRRDAHAERLKEQRILLGSQQWRPVRQQEDV